MAETRATPDSALRDDVACWASCSVTLACAESCAVRLVEKVRAAAKHARLAALVRRRAHRRPGDDPPRWCAADEGVRSLSGVGQRGRTAPPRACGGRHERPLAACEPAPSADLTPKPSWRRSRRKEDRARSHAHPTQVVRARFGSSIGAIVRGAGRATSLPLPANARLRREIARHIAVLWHNGRRPQAAAHA